MGQTFTHIFTRQIRVWGWCQRMISTPSFCTNSRFGSKECSICLSFSSIWNYNSILNYNEMRYCRICSRISQKNYRGLKEQRSIKLNPIWILISIIRVLHFVVDVDCVNWKKKKLVQNILYTHAFDFDTSNKNNNVIIIGPY